MSIIKISVYNEKQYTKGGRLKKNARSDMSRMQVDVEPYTVGARELFIKETAGELAKVYENFESPYVFSHIQARKKDTGEIVRIYEEVNLSDGSYIITSPQRLLGNLTGDTRYNDAKNLETKKS